MVEVYDSRQKKIIIEDQFGGAFLHFLYNTAIGRSLLKLVFVQPWFWDRLAGLQKRPSTIARVNAYIEKYAISKDEYVHSNWQSFNDFFNRQFKPGGIKLPKSSRDIMSVAEAKLLAVAIDADVMIELKHRKYSVASIIGSHDLAAQYEGGTALVYRLSMHNYHRYLFPDDGEVVSTKKYKGVLHTVSSIASDYPVYSMNQRVVSVLRTAHFGEVIMIEVGAMMAGTITNHSVDTFTRGQEKGYFEIGGSTVLVLYKKATIELNEDIKKYSHKDIEVTVKVGEGIGRHA